ncbi:MAG: vitamin K epoxide reductase family protein [Wenzhouxiangellaceae bacterium]|nr:vitamin K epoxide reductase family protein [Wenzhouxiangellaceae bacterium]
MARRRKPSKSAPLPPPRPVGTEPDWVIFALALVGVAITGILTWTTLTAQAPAFCGAESGCAAVQNSRYSTLIGLPVSLWGLLLYLFIAWSAWAPPAKPKRWRRLAWLAGIGLAISVYLTVVGLVVLDAWCAWCMASLATITAIAVAVALRRPESGTGGWAFVGNVALVALFVAGAVGAWQGGVFEPPENPRLKGLAEHLDASGARYFGASWCVNCQEQSAMFGRSADRLPYIECAPGGRGGVVAMECLANDITGYPTWIIDGRRFQQVLTPEQLARYSGYREWFAEDAHGGES